MRCMRASPPGLELADSINRSLTPIFPCVRGWVVLAVSRSDGCLKGWQCGFRGKWRFYACAGSLYSEVFGYLGNWNRRFLII